MNTDQLVEDLIVAIDDRLSDLPLEQALEVAERLRDDLEVRIAGFRDDLKD